MSSKQNAERTDEEMLKESIELTDAVVETFVDRDRIVVALTLLALVDAIRETDPRAWAVASLLLGHDGSPGGEVARA